MTAPVDSRPERVSPDVWLDYLEIMGRARTGRAEGRHFRRLEEIYAEFPELRRKDGR